MSIIFVLVISFIAHSLDEQHVLMGRLTVIGAESVQAPENLWPYPENTPVTTQMIENAIVYFKNEYEKKSVITCGFFVQKDQITDKKQVNIEISICEAEFIDNIACSGNVALSCEKLLAILYHKNGKCFIPDSIEVEIKRMEKFYSDAGMVANINVDITGGRAKNVKFVINEKTTLVNMRITGAKFLKRQDIEKLLTNGNAALYEKYHSLGYFDVDITEKYSAEDGIVYKIINIDEGQRRRCGKLFISEGSKFPEDSIVYHAAWQRGRPFSEDALKNCTESILRFHGDRAYPFAVVKLEELRDKEGEVSPLFSIEANDRFYFGNVSIPGGEKIKRKVLDRITKIETGSPFGEMALEKAGGRLRKSTMFESVDSAMLSIRSGYRIIDVSIGVREGTRNEAEGILGYAPSEADGGKFTGLARIQLKNLFGTGRRISVHYQSEGSYGAASASYREPWLFGSLLDAEGMIDFKTEDSLYTRFDTKLSLSYPLSEYMRVRTGIISSTESWYSDDSSASARVLEYFQTVFGVRFDNRDEPKNPRKGHVIDFVVETGKYFRPVLDIEAYFNVKHRQTIALNAHFESFNGAISDTSVSRMAFLGGTESVRGYRERQFSGLSVLFLRNEYRFLTGNTSRISFFVDGGYADGKSPWLSEINPVDDLLIGCGFGIELGTRAGQLGLLYGVAVRESIRDGKIHIRLKNEF